MSLFSCFSSAAAPTRGPPVDVLLLGSGWTATFLLPLLGTSSLSCAWTTRAGGNGALPFDFDPSSDSYAAFERLPDAKTIVVVFPLYEAAAVEFLLRAYRETRESDCAPGWIQLGSTGIWDHGPTFAPAPPTYGTKPLASSSSSPWKNRHSPHTSAPRAVAEDALLSHSNTSVLNLSGLWGHGRSPRRYIGALAPSKEKLAQLGSVHLVHGLDVARAILAMHVQWEKARGERWLLTNERVYDLWDLCARWGNGGEEGRNHPPAGPQPGWVQELIAESRSDHALDNGGEVGEEKKKHKKHHAHRDPIRSLPRSVEQMGAALDGTDFWSTFGLTPAVPWVD